MKKIATLFALFYTAAFAQSACDTETKKAKALYAKIFQPSEDNYNKCLEKYKPKSEQVSNGRAKCQQDFQVQAAKATCQENTNIFIKCGKEYKAQEIRDKSEYIKCIQASGYNECMQEYQTTRIARDYAKCFEISDYIKCSQEYQAQTIKAKNDAIKCHESNGFTECQPKSKSEIARISDDYKKCLGEYEALTEQIASGRFKCKEEYHAQQGKIISTKAYKEYQTQATKATQICPLPTPTVNISELEKRGDVYFMKNEPYSGGVNCSNCTECGSYCIGNMKNGKWHGEYHSGDEEYIYIGNYKDGKMHGEWKRYENDFVGSELIRLENYKDGEKHGEFKYFDTNGILIKTENY